MRVLFLLGALASLFGIAVAQCPTCLTDATTGCTYTLSGNVNNPSYNLTGSQRLCIMPGAVVTGNWNININSSNARIVNYGSIAIDNLNLNNGKFINHGRLHIGGNLILGNAEMHNHDYLRVGGDFNLNTSQSIFCNTDTTIVNNNFNTTGRSSNNGVIIVSRTFQQNSQGDWCTSTYGLVYSRDLILNGDVYGASASCVGFIVSDVTTVNGSGTLMGTVDICDLNFTGSTTPRLDFYSGTIGSNVTYCNCSQTPLGRYIADAYGRVVGDEIRLEWRATHEPAGNLHTVERWSGHEFADLTTLPGKAGDNHYSASMAAGSQVEQRFRIKVTDVSGAVEYSQVIRVRLDDSGTLEAAVYPVPSQGEVQISVGGIGEASLQLMLMDAQGRVLMTEHRAAGAGTSFSKTITPEIFPASGSYWLRIATPTDAKVLPVLIQR